MALIIKAKMPDCCGYGCDLWNEGICVPLQKAVDTHTRHHDCPIVGEISDEHGRLIDADELQDILRLVLSLVISNELTEKEISLVHRTIGAISQAINEMDTIVEANT